MPRAELLEQIDDRTYQGKVSVKLGPVALSFVGTAQFEAIDEAKQYARGTAHGADATVDLQTVPTPDGTLVDVTTDMTLTGSVAQYAPAIGRLASSRNLQRSLTVSEPGAAASGAPSQASFRETAAVQPANTDLRIRAVCRRHLGCRETIVRPPPERCPTRRCL